MAEEGILKMSVVEVKRAGIIEQVLDGKLKQRKAAKLMGISTRQVRRLVRRVKREGPGGLIHKARGKLGNRLIEKKDKILELCAIKYPDFGPTFASEKLLELDKLVVNRETLRLWLLEEDNDYEWMRKKRPHKKWRPRKECFGEMIQVDGSHHDWLESRGPKLVLMCYVDDATGETYARFYKYEGVKPAMDSMYRYIMRYGMPQQLYVDKHSTYKTTRIQNIFEQLMDEGSLTQFQRGMKELGIDVEFAHSPQAKGRVENKFKTFQDRLVKELRLAKICTMEEANKFLEVYLPKFNKRFAKPAQSEVNLHRNRPSKYVLDLILCIREERSLRKDSRVHYKKKVYLVTNRISNRVSRVIVEERLDGSIRIKHKNRYLSYKEVAPTFSKQLRQEVVKKPVKAKGKSKTHKFSPKHPWTTFNSDYYIDPCDYEDLGKEKVFSNA